MYFVENWHKFLLALIVIVVYFVGSNWYFRENQVEKTEHSMKQLSDTKVQEKQSRDHFVSNTLYDIGFIGVILVCFLIFLGDIRNMFKKIPFAILLITIITGCGRKPFEPINLETIKSNEEAFLLPLTGDGKTQTSSSNEEYLKENLVYTKQVQIPQQWVQKGYETYGWNGEWKDAAILIKVDKSQITREWTADTNSGTSSKNEAIWVMTSDQVEFSAGWTITARIETRDDAIKFLHNYPNGSLTQVMDGEVRSKLQADFGLSVTDLPMDTLRKAATPVIVKVTESVIKFFKQRGITITNIGITGGFVYKDKSIIETMVRVFNAEQEKAIAMAATNAQEERNKSVIFKAQGEADAIMKTKKAEADGIRMVAEARNYELEKAKQDMQAYMQLKQLELQRELLMKWDGSYPKLFMGGNNPNMLLTLPSIDPLKK